MEGRRHDTTRKLKTRPPRPQEKPYLRIASGPLTGTLVALDPEASLLLGRVEGCDVRFEDEAVSRQHARVGVTGARFVVTDLGSSNGTFVNDRQIKERALERGDRILLGSEGLLKFDWLSDEERDRWESSLVDHLTQAWNRRHQDAQLRKLVQDAEESGVPLSVLLLDVDHFGRVNKEHGMRAGDGALRSVVFAMRDALEAYEGESELFRSGGEEFVVTLPHCPAETCLRVAESVRASVASRLVPVPGGEISITASIGCATYPSEHVAGDAPDRELLARADACMRRAKESGRNRVEA